VFPSFPFDKATWKSLKKETSYIFNGLDESPLGVDMTLMFAKRFHR